MGDDASQQRGPALGNDTASRIGAIGERLARQHLESKGCVVVEANYRCRWGEVDLVARDGDVWVFVEVRTRRSESFGSPEESVTAAKARRLTLTAQNYLERRAGCDGGIAGSADQIDWRIDLVAVQLGAGRRVLRIDHLPNVVEEPG